MFPILVKEHYDGQYSVGTFCLAVLLIEVSDPRIVVISFIPSLWVKLIKTIIIIVIIIINNIIIIVFIKI